jgi:5-methylcytosine-specific restriction endonuclease McrA
MQVTSAYLKGKKVGYCSKECGKEAFRKKIAKVKRTNNRRGKQAARIRDGGKCVICGFSHATAVHHIIPKRSGGTDRVENLVTLCPNHHYMVHANLISFDEIKIHGKPFSYPEGNVVLLRQAERSAVRFQG